MKPRDWFALVIRIFGFLLFVTALAYLLSVVWMIITPSEDDAGVVAYVVTGVVFGLMSLYFLRGAPQIVNFAYPKVRALENNNIEAI